MFCDLDSSPASGMGFRDGICQLISERQIDCHSPGRLALVGEERGSTTSTAVLHHAFPGWVCGNPSWKAKKRTSSSSSPCSTGIASYRQLRKHLDDAVTNSETLKAPAGSPPHSCTRGCALLSEGGRRLRSESVSVSGSTWMTRSPTRKTADGSVPRRCICALPGAGGLSSACSAVLSERVPAGPFFMGDSTCAGAAWQSLAVAGACRCSGSVYSSVLFDQCPASWSLLRG